MPAEAIAFAQFGIIMSGFVSIAAGLLVRFSGMKSVEKVLPASITGSIAMVIGLTLAGVAHRRRRPQGRQQKAWPAPAGSGSFRW